jgi:CRISPR/Cas system-associated exonuclease Cas4 (RecB family)
MRDYISHSQVAMFLRCGEQYRQRYIEDRVIPPAIAMIKGSAVHKGAELNWKQKIETKTDLPKNDIVDLAVIALEEKAREDLFLSDEEKTVGKDKLVGAAKDSVVSIAGIYAESMAPTIQPLHSELLIDTNISGYAVKTIIDLVDDKNIIRDMKVTGKSKSQSDVDSSLQLTFYALAWYSMSGEIPGGLIIDNLVEKKTPEYKTISTARTDTDIFRAMRTIEQMAKALQSGVFLPPAEGAWVCSPKFCGYYGSCEYTKSGARF